MNKRTEIILRVNEQAQDDAFYKKSEEIGTLAARTFLEEIKDERQRHSSSNVAKEKKELERHRSQMTSLENIAETTLKVTDVLDFIKKQIGRPNQPGWRKEYEGKRFGESLKQYIENDIKGLVDDVSVRVHSNLDKFDQQHIYLLLIRQFIRQVIAQYEYRVSQIGEDLQKNDQRTRTGTNTAAQR